MNSKTIISITEARKKIFQIAEDVQKPANYYTITENGRAKAVLMSAEQFDSLQSFMLMEKNDPAQSLRLQFYIDLINKYKYPIARIEFSGGKIVVFEDNNCKKSLIYIDFFTKPQLQFKGIIKEAKAIKAKFAVCVWPQGNAVINTHTGAKEHDIPTYYQG